MRELGARLQRNVLVARAQACAPQVRNLKPSRLLMQDNRYLTTR
jgi:hypothetical protein